MQTRYNQIYEYLLLNDISFQTKLIHKTIWHRNSLTNVKDRGGRLYRRAKFSASGSLLASLGETSLVFLAIQVFSDMSHALRRLATGVFSAQRSVRVRPLLRPVSAAKIQGPQRSRSDGVKDTESQLFDESLLEFLVCPLSRKPLRYDCLSCIILLPYDGTYSS